MSEHTEHSLKDEILNDRLTQSLNGFTNNDSTPRYGFPRNFTQPHTGERAAEQITKTSTFPRNVERMKQTKPRFTSYQTFESQHKVLKMPKSFPGIKATEYQIEKCEDKARQKLVENEEHAETKLTLDDIEKVLTPRREHISGVKTRSGEKLPRIKITIAKDEVLNATKSGIASAHGRSHAFNCARMLTELNEVCSLKSEGNAGEDKCESDSLRLKTVHEARRYSAFTPRGNREKFSYARRKSMPNLNSREVPKRFFVKLDPLRASATQVNLNSWNKTSQRCRILSENLCKLDEQGIEPSEKERKVLIGQWIREISQSEYENNHVTTAEIET